MKHIYFVLWVGLLGLQACGGLNRVEKKPQLTITPEKLFLAVDTKADPYVIPVNYTLHIPRGYVPSCARLVYVPRLVAPGHKYSLPPVVVTGRNYERLEVRRQLFGDKQPDYPNALELVSNGDSMNIPLDSRIPFELWMADAKLEAEILLDACDRKTTLYTLELAGGIFYMPVMPGPALVKYVEEEVEKQKEGYARFYFPVNGYEVDPDWLHNRSRLDSLSALLHRIETDSAVHIGRIVVTGICSPDGSWGYNEKLAKRRAEFMRNYLLQYDAVSSGFVETKYIAEDWKGLADLIEKSSLPDKESLLNAIRNVRDPEQREAVLRRSPQFNYIKTHFYPQLRKAICEIYYTVKEKVIKVEPE